MSFPVEPEAAPSDEQGLFVVQDPQVRASILPLFSFDPNHPDERPIGHGTTFRIDPWSRCLTAFHVMEDLLVVNTAGTATVFAGWNMPERIMGSIDPDNPGRFLCVGVFDQAGQLARAFQASADAQRFAAAERMTDLAVISIDPRTGEHMRYGAT